jgi:hypothetical protein
MTSEQKNNVKKCCGGKRNRFRASTIIEYKITNKETRNLSNASSKTMSPLGR